MNALQRKDMATDTILAKDNTTNEGLVPWGDMTATSAGGAKSNAAKAKGN
jgi:hypothetical protein